MKDILNVFYIYYTDFIKVWLVFWGIINFKPKKILLPYVITGMIQLISIFITAFLNKNYSDASTFITTFSVILTVGVLFEGNYFKNMAYSLLVYFLVTILDGAFVGISSMLTNMSGHEFLHYSFIPYIFNYVNIFTILLIVFIKRRRIKSKIQVRISKRIYALLFAGALTSIMIIAALTTKANDAIQESGQKIVFFITIIAIFVYNIACIMMIVITESRDKYKTLSIISQNIIESQQQYYNLVNEKQQEMRSIRHEMKNHLYCIHGLYQANKQTEMGCYIKQLIDTADISEGLLCTGNDFVDAILNDAQSRCIKENIIIRLEDSFPKELYIQPMDLCVIFANTVSNAIEAIQQMDREEGRREYIDIKIRNFKDDLYIEVRNPVSKNADIKIGKFQTTKQNKDLHGFGVKNIIQRVENYQGTVKYIHKNNEIFVTIEMKNRA